MRLRAKKDLNQDEVVAMLRKVPGVKVLLTHQLGGGAPDFVIGYQDVNSFVELKNPDMPPSKRKLTEDEAKFHRLWTGQVDIALTFEDCLRIIGIEVYDPDEILF